MQASAHLPSITSRLSTPSLHRTNGRERTKFPLARLVVFRHPYPSHIARRSHCTMLDGLGKCLHSGFGGRGRCTGCSNPLVSVAPDVANSPCSWCRTPVLSIPGLASKVFWHLAKFVSFGQFFFHVSSTINISRPWLSPAVLPLRKTPVGPVWNWPREIQFCRHREICVRALTVLRTLPTRLTPYSTTPALHGNTVPDCGSSLTRTGS